MLGAAGGGQGVRAACLWWGSGPRVAPSPPAAAQPGNTVWVPAPAAPAPQGRSCRVMSQRMVYKDAASGGEVKHVELSMDRGVPWDAALAFK